MKYLRSSQHFLGFYDNPGFFKYDLFNSRGFLYLQSKIIVPLFDSPKEPFVACIIQLWLPTAKQVLKTV